MASTAIWRLESDGVRTLDAEIPINFWWYLAGKHGCFEARVSY